MSETNRLYKVVTVNCYNRMGSTGKIIEDISAFCEDRYAFSRIYEYEEIADTRPNSYRINNEFQRYFYYIFNRLTGYKYCTGLLPTTKAVRLIKNLNPDIVHLHCPNMGTIHITRLMRFLKKRNIPTVITNHAEFYYTGNCPHAFDCTKYMTGCGNCDYIFDVNKNYCFDRTAHEWKLMKKAFAEWKRVAVVSVSPWQKARSAASPIMEGIEQQLILNGVDEKVFYRRTTPTLEAVRAKGYKKIILHVTAGFTNDPEDLKNGKGLIELAEHLPQYAFVVVGPNHVTDPLPDNVISYGWVADQNRLAELYSDADLTVITSKRETFGMSCAESLCCGTPVVGYCAGGPETVALPEYSKFVPYNDTDQLANVIINWAECSFERDVISAEAITVYKKENMGRKYRELYDRFVSQVDE